MTSSLIASSDLRASVGQLRSGELSLLEHVDTVCDRIEAVDGRVRAVLPEPGRRQRLLGEAEELLRRYPEAEGRPALFGALLGVKDIFNAEGFATRAGSALPPEHFAGAEATSVGRLREAGALVVGKTVSTEFAYVDPGATANPHDTRRTPGGSSSGSAAAVAAGMAGVALGSQTVGSVIRPAAFCGVTGYKPSYGRIPTDGMLIFSETADHVGVFGQGVAGVELAASVVCDGWRSAPEDRRETAERARPTLAVPVGAYLEQANAEALSAFEAQVERLASQGCRVRRLPMLDDIAALSKRHRTLVAAEFAMAHDERYREFGSLYRANSAMLVDEGRAIGAEALAEARASTLELRERVEAVMAAEGIEALICPSAVGAAPVSLRSTGDPAMNMPWTHTGQPVLTLPGATSGEGMPLGLQVVGRFHADEDLFALATVIEGLL